ncbi:hypothetical protein ACTXT7_004461 [Hymenolepis weldensis]
MIVFVSIHVLIGQVDAQLQQRRNTLGKGNGDGSLGIVTISSSLLRPKDPRQTKDFFGVPINLPYL